MSDIVNLGSTNLFGVNRQPSIDRARGGLLKIKVTIPSETVKVDGAKLGPLPRPGTITTKEMKTTVEIDWEKLPLVNTAAYKINEKQVSPDEMPYPPEDLDFTFSK